MGYKLFYTQRAARDIFKLQSDVKGRIVDIKLELVSPSAMVWIELKYWLIGSQKGTRYRARFYFMDSEQGIRKDVEKLNQIDNEHTFILSLAVTNPGNEDWLSSIQKFNEKFNPYRVDSLSNPDRFPDTYFLGLMKVSM